MRSWEFTNQKNTFNQHSTIFMFIIFSFFMLGLLAVWLLDWHFDRTGYWLNQRDWFITLNSSSSAWPKWVWSNITLLGDATVLIPLMSPLIIWRPKAWAAILASVPAASAFSVIGKYLVATPRPAAILDQQQFEVIGQVLAGNNSFPSEHAITIFAGLTAVLAILSLRQRGLVYWIMLITGILVAVTVSFSRIAVGAHWPLDILAGALCGLIAGLSGAAIAQCYQGWWRSSLGSVGRYLLSAVLLMSSLSLIQTATESPLDGPVLWLSGVCGMVASIGLIMRRSRVPFS